MNTPDPTRRTFVAATRPTPGSDPGHGDPREPGGPVDSGADDEIRQSPLNGSQAPADRASEGTPGEEPEPSEIGQQAHEDAESERVDTGWAPATDDTYRKMKKRS